MAGRRVVIIGAGIGGIYTAAMLAKHGYDVTVYEKNKHAGGRCNFLKEEGYSFDTGPTILMMPEIYARAFFDLDERIDDHLKLTSVDPSYHIFYRDGTKLLMTADQNIMEKQLEEIEAGSYQALRRYIRKGESYYKLAMPNLINRSFDSFFDYFNLKNLGLAFKLNLFTNHYNYVGKFFHNHKLKEAFSFQDTYLGLNPCEAPAMFSMLTYLELTTGVWLPKGGMYSIVKSIVSLAEQLGAKFVYESPVKQINVREKKVTGVTLSDEQKIDADIVVANADLTYVYEHLLKDIEMAQHLLTKKYTCTVITFFWGLDKQYPQLGTHNLFMSGHYRESFNQVMNDLVLPDDPSFYVHTPVDVDPQRAPEGHDTVVAIVPVGHINDANPQNWDQIRNRARAHVISRLSGIGITDIEQHIRFERSYTALDWLGLYNLTKGSTLGLYHNLMQMGYMRPKNRHKRYHNLYFVGSNIHPGSGVPTVLISARLTSERILKEQTN